MLGMKDPPVTTTTSGKLSLETSKQPKVSTAAPVLEPLGAVGGPKLFIPKLRFESLLFGDLVSGFIPAIDMSSVTFHQRLESLSVSFIAFSSTRFWLVIEFLDDLFQEPLADGE